MPGPAGAYDPKRGTKRLSKLSSFVRCQFSRGRSKVEHVENWEWELLERGC